MFKTRKKCFTLIELMIVISIVGILSSVIVLSLSELRRKAQVAAWLSYNKQTVSLFTHALNAGDLDVLPSDNSGYSGCLGDYSEYGNNCAGDIGGAYNQYNTVINNIIEKNGKLPLGRFAPSYVYNGHDYSYGSIFYMNKKLNGEIDYIMSISMPKLPYNNAESVKFCYSLGLGKRCCMSPLSAGTCRCSNYVDFGGPGGDCPQ